MYRVFVAFRYLLRNWLNLVGIAAVAIGVLVLICVLSVMKGFDQEFRARLRATVSDLVIESWSDDTFGDYEALIEKMEALPHVEACAPRFEGVALIRMDTEYGKLKRFAQFNGIVVEREIRATDFDDYWRGWRGRSARERIEIELQDDGLGPVAALDAFSPDDLGALVEGLRPEDFQRLSSRQREALSAAAEQHGLSMQVVYQESLAAVPVWGGVENPEQCSPAFAGLELLKVGSDVQGNEVTLGVGSRVVVFTPTDLFDGRAIRRCEVVGAFHSGLYDYDLRNIYLPLEDVQTFMSKPDEVTSVNVRLDDFANAPLVRAQLLGVLTPGELARGGRLVKPFLRRSDMATFREFERNLDILRAKSEEWFMEGSPLVMSRTMAAETALFTLVAKALNQNSGEDTRALKKLRAFRDFALERKQNPIAREFRVSTWQDKRRTFLRAVELERRMMGFILFFVILIAGFLVLSILHTTVITKTRDIGMLKSIGGTVGGIMSIFLLNGFFIGMIGSGLGTLGGVVITSNINEIEAVLHRLIGFTLFPSNIYYLDRIPTDQAPLASTAAICVTAVVVSLLASALPAWKAARMNPVEALRYE